MIRVYSNKDFGRGDVYDCDKWGFWDRLDECKRYEKFLVAESKDLVLSILFFVSLVLGLLYMIGFDYVGGIITAIPLSIWAGATYYCGGKAMIKRYADNLEREATYE